MPATISWYNHWTTRITLNKWIYTIIIFIVFALKYLTWHASQVEFLHKPAHRFASILVSFKPHWLVDWIGTSTSRKYRKFPVPWVSPHPVTSVRSPTRTKSLTNGRHIARTKGLNLSGSDSSSKAMSWTHRDDFPLYAGYYREG